MALDELEGPKTAALSVTASIESTSTLSDNTIIQNTLSDQSTCPDNTTSLEQSTSSDEGVLDQEPLLAIFDATVYRDDYCVFEKLTLTINQAESVAILGPNGCGKTTLLKLISREIYPVVRPGSYCRLFGQESVNIWALREKIGLVSEALQLRYPAGTTGLAVVLSGFWGAEGAHAHLQATPQQKKMAEDIIETLGLTALSTRLFHQLSTGQKRRLLLARAMIHRPQTLIFDEPTHGLDIQASFLLLRQLRQYHQQGGSVILATHHIHEIIPEISRVILMKAGQIIADGDKQAILTDQHLSALYETPLTVVEQGGYFQVFPR